MKLKQFLMRIMLRLFGAKVFSKILLQTEGSKTYIKFCEKVYGRYLCQFNMVDEEQLQKLISLIGDGKEKKILDLGCGSGYISEYIVQQTGASIVGIDFAKGAIKSAQNRVKNIGAEFSVGNINELSFPDESFDYVLTIDTLYFGSDLGKIVKDIKRILKPNGKLITFYSSKKDDLNKSGPEYTGIGKVLAKKKVRFLGLY
jgi:ubiquinone/menaquinone biosynthesis C-methylase UbiE